MNQALLQSVANRGKPPEQFLAKLIEWAKSERADVFAPNTRVDIYSLIKGTLGPWDSAKHRRAAMCEVLRVLAGFESSWNWTEGKDITNPAENSPDTESAGAFQISYNSTRLHPSLQVFAESCGIGDAVEFRKTMMENPEFACAYTARLLRVNLRHNGPVKRGEILAWLKRDAVSAFQLLL